MFCFVLPSLFPPQYQLPYQDLLYWNLPGRHPRQKGRPDPICMGRHCSSPPGKAGWGRPSRTLIKIHQCLCCTFSKRGKTWVFVPFRPVISRGTQFITSGGSLWLSACSGKHFCSSLSLIIELCGLSSTEKSCVHSYYYLVSYLMAYIIEWFDLPQRTPFYVSRGISTASEVCAISPEALLF